MNTRRLEKRTVLAVILCLCAPAFAEEMVATLNESLTLGQPLVVDNVTVWPVFRKAPKEAIADYVTLPQAQEKAWPWSMKQARNRSKMQLPQPAISRRRTRQK